MAKKKQEDEIYGGNNQTEQNKKVYQGLYNMTDTLANNKFAELGNTILNNPYSSPVAKTELLNSMNKISNSDILLQNALQKGQERQNYVNSFGKTTTGAVDTPTDSTSSLALPNVTANYLDALSQSRKNSDLLNYKTSTGQATNGLEDKIQKENKELASSQNTVANITNKDSESNTTTSTNGNTAGSIANSYSNLLKEMYLKGEQENAYQTAVAEYLGRDFSYNPATDQMYQTYLATMNNLGQRAMKDTMGQASALSGGYGSSYAQNVGSQAYNQYLEQANQNLPSYYNMALNKYTQEQSDLANKIDLLNPYTSSSSGTGSISGTNFANILKGAGEANLNGELDLYMKSLDGYDMTEEQVLDIMDYANMYVENEQKKAQTPVSYNKSEISGWGIFNIKSNDKVEIEYQDGHTETVEISQLKGILSPEKIKELKKAPVGTKVSVD